MSQTPPLMKTCAACGLSKSLSAFLQVTGPEGTTYTNICATCRKAQMESPSGQNERDESTTSDTSHTIDSKTKVKSDTEKRDLRKQVEEDYFEEREKDQLIDEKVIEKQQSFHKDEKKHRDSFLKKSVFLNNKNIPTDATKVYGSEAQSSKAGRFDFTAPVEDTRTPQIKHSGAIFNQFKSWLGKSAPIGQRVADKPSSAPTQKDVTDYIDKTWGPGARKK